MGGLVRYVQWVWELSVAIQLVVCAMLFVKGNFRRIPFFTAYVLSNVFQAAALYVIYRQLGYGSRSAALFAWWSQCVPQLLRVLAISEVLRLILKPYRGIWGLGWRVLTFAFCLVFSIALIGSRRDLSWTVLVADRGLHLAFGVAIVGCLLLVRYYLLPIHPVYKALLGGFCFYSCIVVLGNTIGAILFLRGSTVYQIVWQFVTMGAFIVVLALWAVVLRTPLPESAREKALLDAKGAYWEMSPQINERLRRLNELLDRLWKRAATQP